MSRITMGFKPEVLAQLPQVARRGSGRFLLRCAVIFAGCLAVFAALILTTDIEELLLPRTVILRGNRLSSVDEVLAVAGIPDGLDIQHILPRKSDLPEGRSRWIRSVSTRMLSGRRMLLSVDERMPLLPLEIGGNSYWICGDGEVVARFPDRDTDGRFKELNRLPLVSMQGSGIDADYEVAEMLILTAGVCRELLDRRIIGIEVSPGGEFNLRTDRGLRVQLGIPQDEEQVRRRLSALSKAIRISDQYADATAIDLRNGKVAYLRTAESE